MKDPQSSQHTKLIRQPFVPSAGGSESPRMEPALHLHPPLFHTLLVCKGQSSYLPELRDTKTGWTTCFGRPRSASRENGGGTRRSSRGEASKPSCRFHQGSSFLPQLNESFWSQEYKELVKAEEERRKREEDRLKALNTTALPQKVQIFSEILFQFNCFRRLQMRAVVVFLICWTSVTTMFTGRRYS